ncbi:MAG: hypothetical protein CMH32_01230 [Micavibrio sp.]|nr:hypothetical protein [Micavibrio sp.]HCK33393.1 hypothetical protein [Rhodospirillaceae bacterium]|tara:strand:+ start:41 stop:358 length:318 start_codon:yes stop_codon:yes gene_type:complete
MALWRWEKGRQGGGYEKLKLFQIFNRADCYLLRYPEGFELPPHKDPVEHGRHFRLNIVLAGIGRFYAEKCLFDFGPIKFFRPDKYEHGVEKVTKPRLVFSFGFVI